MVDLRQTQEWANYLFSWGWQIKQINCDPNTKANIFIKKFPIIPLSFFKFQRFSGKPIIEEINEIKRKYNIIYSIIEPIDEQGILPPYRQMSSYYIPSKTIVINLTKPENTLFQNLSQNAKRILHKKNQLQITETDLKTFYPPWKAAAKIYVPPFSRINTLLSIFGDRAKLLISHDNSKPLSGILLLSSQDTVNYFYTWTNETGRQKNAHYYLVWYAIIDSKKSNYRYFDLEGIFDHRFPNKNWLGFSEFKNKFGGEVISYPGCFGCWF